MPAERDDDARSPVVEHPAVATVVRYDEDPASDAARTRPLRLGARRAGLSRVRTDRSVYREPALVLVLPVTFLAYVYATANMTADRYPLGRASSAHEALIAVAPFVATAVAWEMGTLRRLWGRLTVRRPWWQVVAGRSAVPVASALAVMLAVYVVLLAGLPSPAPPGWTFPILSTAGVLGWAAFGVAVGLSVGPVVALPVTLLVPFLVLTLPAGWSDPLWVRHATGLMTGCCTTSSVVEPRAFRASLSVLAVLAVVSGCVAAVRLAPARPRRRRLLTALSVALAATAGCLVVVADLRGMGPEAVADRPSSAVQCRGEVCLWPEDAFAYETNTLAWSAVRQAWSELGLPPPPATIGPPGSGTALPIAVTSPTVASAQGSMAWTLPRALRGCLDRAAGGVVTGTDNDAARFNALTYLLTVHLGVPGPVSLSATVQPLPRPADALAIWSSTAACPE